MLRTKVPNDNDAILSPFNLQVYKNGGFQIEVCLAVWKSNANKPSPLWYLNCFLFDNPIIVSRAVSIALAISSWTNHSRNLKHFRFDSAIFWQFKAIRGGLTRIGIDFVFLLIMLIPWKSVFSSFCLIIAVRKTENCRRSNRAVIGTCYCPVPILKYGDMIFPKHPRAAILVSMQTKKTNKKQHPLQWLSKSNDKSRSWIYTRKEIWLKSGQSIFISLQQLLWSFSNRSKQTSCS